MSITSSATNAQVTAGNTQALSDAVATFTGTAVTDLTALDATATTTSAHIAKQQAGAGPRCVRGVVTANIANLASFTVASNDGLTYVAGERVLLAGQTTASQCGIYVVGTVASGTAPLTRATDFAAASAIVNGCVVEVSEGTVWRGSSWKAMCTGACVVGTDDPLFYPRSFRKTVTLSSGTYTIGAGGGSEALFLYSTTTSSVQATRNTVGGTVTATIMYAAPVSARVAGKAGTAAAQVNAVIDAGTTNAADTSTVDVFVSNW